MCVCVCTCPQGFLNFIETRLNDQFDIKTLIHGYHGFSKSSRKIYNIKETGWIRFPQFVLKLFSSICEHMYAHALLQPVYQQGKMVVSKCYSRLRGTRALSRSGWLQDRGRENQAWARDILWHQTARDCLKNDDSLLVGNGRLKCRDSCCSSWGWI